MRISHTLIAILLWHPVATHAVELEPIISRPVTLRQGAVDLTLHGTYAKLESGIRGRGETLATGVEVGATNRVELGVAAAFPINPGAGFGSLLGSVALAAGKDSALRIDAGYESIGDSNGVFRVNRYFGGLGARIRIPIGSTLAFVTGRTGAVQFGHFNNTGNRDAGFGFYVGASSSSEAASDFFVVSAGDNNSPTDIGINVPAGLLLQPDPHLAVTLQAGYSLVIEKSSFCCFTDVRHYIPLGLEAVLTPIPFLDFGLRFFLDGQVPQHGGTRYDDNYALMFWLDFHA